MIVYFADRQLNIIGQASTRLPDGLVIVDDVKSEDIETGVAIFECKIPFTNDTRAKVEECTAVGNYVLRSVGDASELYTIIDVEIKTKKQTVTVYAEDAGMDLLNEIHGAYEADKAYPIAHYIELFAGNSGFKIGINEAASLARKLAWDGEATAAERIASVATQFDGCEISYSFDVDGLFVRNKYINIYKQRGKDVGITLRLNEDIDNIVTTKSIANLATALQCTGDTPESETDENGDLIDFPPITLEGYSYDDSDFYVDGDVLKSREALKTWQRYLWKDGVTAAEGGHITRPYQYKTLDQATLCASAITELKKLREVEINYECEFSKLPENVKIGDRVNIVDNAGDLYVSARVLSLETSIANMEERAVLGEYLIKSSGISQKVADLAAQFATVAEANKKARLEALKAAQQAQAEAEEAQRLAEEAAAKAAQAEADLAAAQAAAEEAQRIAEEAQAEADAAAQAAAQAKADAADANAAVEIAQSAAQTATQKAEAAQRTADEVKADATDAATTAAAAKLDAEKAKEDVAALGENLSTLESTMQADYARKTDLTEAQASLQTQITQNAAEISSTATKVQEIDETANDAADKAEAAQNVAGAAQAQADQAVADAAQAQQAATDAATAASNAQTQADTAKTAADAAQKAADDADAKADAAAADLESAKQNLANVTSRVDVTEEEVAAAQAAVETAQAAADKAKEDAAAAQSTADTAKTNATNAQTAANNAKTAADNAKAAADAAKKAADDAQADVDALVVRVTTAETNITQNSEQIALRATKTEVMQTLGGYYTKTEADAAIVAKANEINLSVDSKIEGIEVGGRNLLLKSRDMTVTGNRWTGWLNYAAYTFEEDDEGFHSVSVSASGLTDPMYLSFYSPVVKASTGDKFTISCWFKVDDLSALDNQKVYIFEAFSEAGERLQWDDVSLDRSLTAEIASGEWIKLVSHHTVTCEGENLNCGLRLCLFQNGSVHYKKCKMEIGNKATDWTPAPEDVDEAIDNSAEELRQTISEEHTSILAASNQILLEALKSYTETGDFEAFKETTESQLRLLSDQMTLQFTQTTEQLNAVNNSLQEQLNAVTKYFVFSVDGMTIGQVDNPNKVVIDNDEIAIEVNGNVVQKFDANGKGIIPDLQVSAAFELLGYLFEKDESGNVNCEFVG